MITSDLTVIYASAHKIPEDFAINILDELQKAAGDYPILEVHSTPEKSSINNYYRELLGAAKEATTDYIAFAEDDTLYPDEHFLVHRPPMDTFAYNFSRWNLYTWSEPPFFSLRQRRIIGTCIAPRQLFIEAMGERFAKYENPPEMWMGEPGRNQHEKALGVTQQKSEVFETYSPVVVFSHPDSFGYESTGDKKRAGKIRALELFHWGTAQEVMDIYGS